MKKKQKKSLKIIGIILVVSILVLLIYFILPKDQPFLKVQLFDKDGNIINQISGFSTIDIPLANAYYMALTITVKNTGTIPLSCNILSASPVQFNNSISKIPKGVNPNNQIQWTSNLINISQFVGIAQPIRFNVTTSCNFNGINGSKKLSSQSGFVDLNIHSICGNNICDSDETCNSCGRDCCPNKDYAVFRTNNLFYESNGAIAYTNTCGSTLTRYGLESSTCWTLNVLTCPSRSGYTLILDQNANIKGRPIWAVSNISGCLYQDDNNATKVAMAWRVNSALGSTCPSSGYWGIKIYSQSSPLAINVDSSSSILNLNNEITCIK